MVAFEDIKGAGGWLRGSGATVIGVLSGISLSFFADTVSHGCWLVFWVKINRK